MYTLTITNQKGGVGKTTTSLAVATGLAQQGYKVLCCDLDPQCNFSLSCPGVDILELDATIYDAFKGTATVDDVLMECELGFSVMVGGLQLAGADMEFVSIGRENMLRELLESVSDHFDFCILDCPPALGILTVNAMSASDSVLIPLALDIYSLQGLSQLSGLIANTRKYCNPGLKIVGLLVTKYHGNQNLSKALIEQIQEAATSLGTKVYGTYIRESVAVRETQLLKSNLFLEAPRANAVVDYKNFINELLEDINNG